MSLPIQGIQFHSYLLNKLMGTPNESKLRIVQQILKPCPTQIDRARETFALFAKMTGPEPFAHMCALSAAVVDQPFVWPFQYRIDNRFTIPIPDSVVSVLYDLGRLVMMFPKLCYLNVTVDEYIERRLAFKMFFNDIQYEELHAFWRIVGKSPRDHKVATKREPLVITPELCDKVKSNLWIFMRILLKNLLMEEVNGFVAQEGNFNLKLAQDLQTHFCADLPPDLGEKMKGTVMMKLIAANRLRNLTRHMQALMPPDVKSKLLEEVSAFEQDQVHEKLEALRAMLPADYVQHMGDILRNEVLVEKDILKFLLCSTNCFPEENQEVDNTKAEVKDDIKEVVQEPVDEKIG